MTRKDYIEVARILREEIEDPKIRQRVASRFVTFFADDNPRFSPTRFRDAVEQAEDHSVRVGR